MCVCVCVRAGAEKQYIDGFVDELRSFRERIRKRAKERVEEALERYEVTCFIASRFASLFYLHLLYIGCRCLSAISDLHSIINVIRTELLLCCFA